MQPTSAVPGTPPTRVAPPEDVAVDPVTPGGGSDDESEGLHGLGWLLKQHGLGAVTVVPDAEPAAPEEETPEDVASEPQVDRAPEAAHPVSGAAVKPNWFAPAADTHTIDGEADRTGEPLPEEQSPADRDTAARGGAEADEPGAADGPEALEGRSAHAEPAVVLPEPGHAPDAGAPREAFEPQDLARGTTDLQDSSEAADGKHGAELATPWTTTAEPDLAESGAAESGAAVRPDAAARPDGADESWLGDEPVDHHEPPVVALQDDSGVQTVELQDRFRPRTVEPHAPAAPHAHVELQLHIEPPTVAEAEPRWGADHPSATEPPAAAHPRPAAEPESAAETEDIGEWDAADDPERTVEPAPAVDPEAAARAEPATTVGIGDADLDADANPGQPDPIPVEPVRIEPVQADRVEVEPTQPDRAQAQSIPPEPVQAELTQGEPVHVEPVRTEQVPAEPLHVEAVQAQPVEAPSVPIEPAQAQPVRAEPVHIEPAQAEPVEAQQVEAQQVEAQQVEAEPVEADPVHGEPAQAEQADAGPPQGEPVAVETAGVGPATAREPEPIAEPAPRPATAGAAAPASPAPAFARQPGHYGDQGPRRLVDPEQILASYPWRISPDTLREVVDQPEDLLAVRDRLTDKLEYAERDAVRARLMSLRAVVSRVLGDLDFALADGRAALAHAEATGELRRTAIVRARLAHVLRWRGEFAEADRLFEEANSVELPDRLRAEMYELAGRSAFDQGRHLEALHRFEQALALRTGDDDQMVSRIELALDSIMRRVRETGWGPYPRALDEIVPRPAQAERWPANGYAQARPFSDGLAWVSREAEGGWFAVDEQNRVIVPGGFDDVGPFRNGVAPVRRGAGWGAIDRYGRVVVQPKYRRFVTALVGGRPVDGFTAEGLAVVDAGDRVGVVDRGGQLLVAPVHAALVIHPVAFLIADRAGRWGALDRNGDPLIEVRHRSEADVTGEIDRLLSDTRPVL